MTNHRVTVVVPRDRPVSGVNAPVIRLAMEEDARRGKPEDHVILDGAKILTCSGTYDVTSNSTSGPVDPRNVTGDGSIDPNRERTVLHRKHLWRYVGPEQARKFWRHGRRTRA